MILTIRNFVCLTLIVIGGHCTPTHLRKSRHIEYFLNNPKRLKEMGANWYVKPPPEISQMETLEDGLVKNPTVTGQIAGLDFEPIGVGEKGAERRTLNNPVGISQWETLDEGRAKYPSRTGQTETNVHYPTQFREIQTKKHIVNNPRRFSQVDYGMLNYPIEIRQIKDTMKSPAGFKEMRVEKSNCNCPASVRQSKMRGARKTPSGRNYDAATRGRCRRRCKKVKACGGGNNASQTCTKCVSCNPQGASSSANLQKNTRLAQNAAKDAKAASCAQKQAGEQASAQAKSQLADKACQASNAAQVALAGKLALEESLKDQIKDAESVLQEEQSNLQSVVNTVCLANQAACDTRKEVKVEAVVLDDEKKLSQMTQQVACAVEQIRDEKQQLIEAAKRQIEQLMSQLKVATRDKECTCKLAKEAAASAKQAKQRAACAKSCREIHDMVSFLP